MGSIKWCLIIKSKFFAVSLVILLASIYYSSIVAASCCTNPASPVLCTDGVTQDQCCGNNNSCVSQYFKYMDCNTQTECTGNPGCCCSLNVVGEPITQITTPISCTGIFTGGLIDPTSCDMSCKSTYAKSTTTSTSKNPVVDQCIYYYDGTKIDTIKDAQGNQISVSLLFPSISNKITAALHLNSLFYFYDSVGNEYVFDDQLKPTMSNEPLISSSNVDSAYGYKNQYVYTEGTNFSGDQIQPGLISDLFVGSSISPPSSFDAMDVYGSSIIASNANRLLILVNGVWEEYGVNDFLPIMSIDAMVEFSNTLFMFGDCQNSIGNQKDMSNYVDKQVFMISDNDWRNIMSLVPITTWTKQQGDNSVCQKGYGTANDVCVYPTLIFYYSPYRTTFSTKDFLFVTPELVPGTVSIIDVPSIENDIEVTIEDKPITVGTPVSINVHLKNIASQERLFMLTMDTNSEVDISSPLYMIDVNTKKWVFPSVTSPFTLQPGEETYVEFTLELKKTPDFEAIDVDSSINFLQGFNAQKITLIDDNSIPIFDKDGNIIMNDFTNLFVSSAPIGYNSYSSIEIKEVPDYLDYWKSYDDVVYVEDNYELALAAASYASVINAPLVVQNSDLDIIDSYNLKNIICIGGVNPINNVCSKNLDLEGVQGAFLDATADISTGRPQYTDRLILTNPQDLTLSTHTIFQVEKTGDLVRNIYSKDSLITPFLSSAKHELIITGSLTDPFEYASLIQSKIKDYGLNPKYLTIIGSPEAITTKNAFEIYTVSADTIIYGNKYASLLATVNSVYSIGVSGILNSYATGRMMGMTVTDTSSLLARSLFHDQFLKNANTVSIIATKTNGYQIDIDHANQFSTAFTSKGYTVKQDIRPDEDIYAENNPAIISNWEDTSYVFYNDHGASGWAGISSSQIPKMSNTFVDNFACSTCSVYNSEAMCTTLTRRGAIGNLGAVVEAYTGNKIFKQTINYVYAGDTIGLAYSQAFNKYKKSNHLQMILIGDPTLKFVTTNNYIDEVDLT
ncbi:hypothetical protein K9M79_03250 [Candidatus Woesearchaeota archaeon]|nr:hypothetical protein [Candidatus Woesearchaeota archaeon]